MMKRKMEVKEKNKNKMLNNANHSSVKHSTAQYSTAQHSTVQHSTAYPSHLKDGAPDLAVVAPTKRLSSAKSSRLYPSGIGNGTCTAVTITCTCG